MTYGLTPAGLTTPTLEQIKSELEDSFRASLGADVDTSPNSVLGKLVEVFAQRERAQWTIVEAAYGARSPSTATAAALTVLAELTGTKRRGAVRGRVTLRVRLAAGAALPSGSTAAVRGDASNLWRTVADAANYGATEASIDVVAESVTAGYFEARANTITQIMSPTAGWLSVVNLDDAEPGREVESDAELRERRKRELSMPGTCTVPAIEADLMNPERLLDEKTSTLAAAEIAVIQSAIRDVRVETNRSAWPDAQGRPPHSFETIVQLARIIDPGQLALARAAIGAILANRSPAGVTWHGTQSAEFTADDGTTETVRWSESTYAPVRVDVVFPRGVRRPTDAAIRNAVLAYGSTLRIGSTAKRSEIIARLTKLEGFTDVVRVQLGRDNRREFTVGNVDTNYLAVAGAQLVNGAAVTLVNYGGALPSPLVPGVPYYVRDSAPGEFRLAAIPGGGAINITDAGTGTHALFEAASTVDSNLNARPREVLEFDSARVFIVEE